LTTLNSSEASTSRSMIISNNSPTLAAATFINAEDGEDSSNSTTSFKEKFIINDPNQPLKPLVLFSIDISGCSPLVQFIILIGGLILFMCLYGYYQELVIYGWFERKLSIFSTFLHFLGCSIFAQIQRQMSANSYTHQISKHGHSVAWYHLSMGSATPRLAFFYYFLLVVTKTAAQGLSNLSMSQINYPAKVLFKSVNPIITMIIGVTWFRKSYPLRDYIVVALLVVGLYIFIGADSRDSPQSTNLGIFYVILSMFGSAGVPMIQEHCINSYNASIEDLIYFSFLGSTIISLFLSIITGEFMTGIYFLIQNSSIHTWIIFTAFCTFGFCGANFSTAITAQYGSLVNGISNTFRKAVTIAVSFLMFPERNILTHQKFMGTLIFFCGLLVKIFAKDNFFLWNSCGSNNNNLQTTISSGTQSRKQNESLDQRDSVSSVVLSPRKLTNDLATASYELTLGSMQDSESEVLRSYMKV
jgi:hypothetical protein